MMLRKYKFSSVLCEKTKEQQENNVDNFQALY
jgi:hypothetical protein